MSETQTTPGADNTTQGGAQTAPSPVVENAEKPLLYFGKEVYIGSRKVQVIRIEHFNLIPKTKEAQAVRDEVTLKIGSQWKKGTRDIIRGLTQEEEKRFLPNILGVNANSEKWEDATKLYWADFSIQIPNNDKGITLEAGYKIVAYSDGKKEIIPINMDDYMKYGFCVENGKVANEGEDNPIIHDFKLVDLAAEQREKEAAFSAKKKVEGLYLSLIRSTDPKDKMKIDWILETAAGPLNQGISIDGLTDLQKEMELEKFKNEDTEAFSKAIVDTDLQLKALIRKGVGIGKLELQGTTYIWGNKPLGELDQTIGYFKNPNNAKDRQLLEQAVR